MGVMSGVRPLSAPGELRRLRLLAPPPRPCLELPLEGLFELTCGQSCSHPGGVGPSAPKRGPRDPVTGLGSEVATIVFEILQRGASGLQPLIHSYSTHLHRPCALGTVLGAGDKLVT